MTPFDPNSYKWIFRGQLILIFLLFITIGVVSTITIQKANEAVEQSRELEAIKAEKETYTKRAESAEKALVQERLEKQDLLVKIKKFEKQAIIVKYAARLQTSFAVEGSNPFNRKFTNLEKVVKAVIDLQKFFPEIAKTNKQRIDVGLSIGSVESGCDPSMIGEIYHEVSAFQILPAEVPRLMKKARARGFDVSNDPKEIRTSVVLMYVHLGEKLNDTHGDRNEAVRKYNGNWRTNPSYWLRYLKYYHLLGDIEVDEQLFQDATVQTIK